MTAAVGTLRQDVRVIGLIAVAHGLSHFYQLVVAVLFPLIKVDLGVSYAALGAATARLLHGLRRVPDARRVRGRSLRRAPDTAPRPCAVRARRAARGPRAELRHAGGRVLRRRARQQRVPSGGLRDPQCARRTPSALAMRSAFTASAARSVGRSRHCSATRFRRSTAGMRRSSSPRCSASVMIGLILANGDRTAGDAGRAQTRAAVPTTLRRGRARAARDAGADVLPVLPAARRGADRRAELRRRRPGRAVRRAGRARLERADGVPGRRRGRHPHRRLCGGAIARATTWWRPAACSRARLAVLRAGERRAARMR